MERIGREGFQALLEQLNQELLRLGLLSSRAYVDSSLVKANLSSTNLEPSGLTVEEFAQKATQENGLFTLREVQPGTKEEPARIQVRYYQDPQGRLPLSPVDLDARWRTHSRAQKAQLCYKENLMVDRSGFILARGVSHANISDVEGALPLLEMLPFTPSSLAGDTGYCGGTFRQRLQDQGITAYIPLHPKQERAALLVGDFIHQHDQIICPQGKTLSAASYEKRTEQFRFVAKQADCQGCEQRGRCLPPKSKRKHVSVSRYFPLLEEARRVNASARYRREMKRRRVVVEGVFARQDQLGWEKCRLRGLWKVDCEGYIAALAHNLLKALTKVRWKRRAAMALRGHGKEIGRRLKAIYAQRRLTSLPRSIPSPN
jgi:IS5 family transposase